MALDRASRTRGNRWAVISTIPPVQSPETVVDQRQKSTSEFDTVSFQNKVEALSHELFLIANESRQLVFSEDIHLATSSLQESTLKMLYLFHENETSPRISHEIRKRKQSLHRIFQSQSKDISVVRRNHRQTGSLLQTSYPSTLDAEDIPDRFRAFAKEIKRLLEIVIKVSGISYTDKILHTSMNEFATDLEYWASCLKTYKGRFEEHVIRSYVHDLCGEMEYHLDTVTSSLSTFKNDGIRIIHLVQNDADEQCTFISTIATFFAAVAATALQLNIDSKDTLSRIVNSFWFISIVISVLDITFCVVVKFVMRHTSMGDKNISSMLGSAQLLLLYSVISFAIGFCIFAYSSRQPTATIVVTTVSSSYIAIAVSCTVIVVFGTIPVTNKPRASPLSTILVSLRLFTSLIMKRHLPSARSEETTGLEPPKGAAKARFVTIIHCIIVAQRTFGARSPIVNTKEQREMILHQAEVAPNVGKSTRVTLSSLNSLRHTTTIRHPSSIHHLEFSPDGRYLAICGNHSCFVLNVEAGMTLHQCLQHSDSPVEKLAWSPNSKMLLTKTLRGVKLWNISAESTDVWIGTCAWSTDRKNYIRSVAWYPENEAFLLVEDIEEGEKGTEEASKSQIAKFVVASLESDVRKRQLNEPCVPPEGTFLFYGMLLYDVAVTSDSQRMLCVARLTMSPSPDNLKPSVSREERQIFVYNLLRGKFEYRLPTLQNVRNITLSTNGQFVLVSYEIKAPPQLWEVVKIPEEKASPVILQLMHSYESKSSVEFAGPSYFAGKNDELVLSAMKAGDIHIWDRRTGYLLRTLPAQYRDDDLTSIAWNRTVSPLMLVSGSSNGAVRIWSSTTDTPQSRESPGDPRKTGRDTGGMSAAGSFRSLPGIAEEARETPGSYEILSSPWESAEGAEGTQPVVPATPMTST